MAVIRFRPDYVGVVVPLVPPWRRRRASRHGRVTAQLEKRKAIKEQAMADMKQAEEEGKTEDVDRYSKRTVHMTKAHQEDCKTLLRLMGVPVVEVRVRLVVCACSRRKSCSWHGAYPLWLLCRDAGAVRGRGTVCCVGRSGEGEC